ncbi:hypothetical protein JCM11491_005804 [Sporobolomyces phaffii]
MNSLGRIGSARRSPSIRSPSPLLVGSSSSSSGRKERRRLLLAWGARLAVAVVVAWFELGTFLFAGLATRFTCTTTITDQDDEGGFTVLVVADPQVLDMRKSYPERSKLARWVSIAVTNRFLSKSWTAVTTTTRRTGTPVDAVVWNGDLLDNGRDMDDDEYADYARQFHRLFPLPRQQRRHAASASASVLAPPVPVVYVPGNHDLRLDPFVSTSSKNNNGSTQVDIDGAARARFRERFGPLWGEREWNGWNVVTIDAVQLVNAHGGGGGGGGREDKKKKSDMVEWIDELGRRRRRREEEDERPRILFSHVPLWRPAGTHCGPLREAQERFAGGIRDGYGPGYQNLVAQDDSEWVLDRVGPAKVFSGDDHDYCFVTHRLPPGDHGDEGRTVTETTVKSFSMSMGISRPGFTLLTLYPPRSSLGGSNSTPTTTTTTTTAAAAAPFTERSCVLPSQLGIYLDVYVPLAAALYLALVVPKLYRLVTKFMKRRRGRRRRRHRRALGTDTRGARTWGPWAGGRSATLEGGRGPEKRQLGEEVEDDDDEEEEDALFPTSFRDATAANAGASEYGYSASLGGAGGLAEEDSAGLVSNRPSPLRSEIHSDDDDAEEDEDEVDSDDEGGGDAARRGSRVRRVSRVWSWEKPSGGGGAYYHDDADADAYSAGSRWRAAVAEWVHRGVARVSQHSQIVPALRLVRPVVRLARTTVFVVLGRPLAWATTLLGGERGVARAVTDAAREFWSVASLGVGVWAAVWVWAGT